MVPLGQAGNHNWTIQGEKGGGETATPAREGGAEGGASRTLRGPAHQRESLGHGETSAEHEYAAVIIG